MEKISRILPPSNRVTTVDTESSPSLRPGAPAMGRRAHDVHRSEEARPVNVDRDRMTLSPSAMDRLKGLNIMEGEEEASEGNNSKKSRPDSSKIKIVEDLNRRFFANMRKEYLGRSVPKSEQFLEDIEGN